MALDEPAAPAPDILDDLPSLLNLREHPTAEVYAALRRFICSDEPEVQMPWMDTAQRHVMHTICDAIGLQHESRGEDAYRVMFVSRPSADWRMPESVQPIPRLGRRRHTPSVVPALSADMPMCACCGREPDECTRLVLMVDGTVSCITCMRERSELAAALPQHAQAALLPAVTGGVELGARAVESAR
ncbi:hypothetical protein KFE25_005741 [Diacronema lutheri]|uniref:R3H domain-containing protein n=1 Tax=Diacronema lutheri TaxID=2081491 RepID=A0A8J6C6S2_DIALT|nr:hypothetical protein KFE25_005741 [Diacronema lutheri]